MAPELDNFGGCGRVGQPTNDGDHVRFYLGLSDSGWAVVPGVEEPWNSGFNDWFDLACAFARGCVSDVVRKSSGQPGVVV